MQGICAEKNVDDMDSMDDMDDGDGEFILERGI